jgi:acetylornithine deacetylase/succinyl-diaminopimelate desuccinylase-like protein
MFATLSGIASVPSHRAASAYDFPADRSDAATATRSNHGCPCSNRMNDWPTAPVAYTTDIPLLGRWGTPLLFGPGSIHVAHTPDEFIDVDELRNAVGAYERIVKSVLSE